MLNRSKICSTANTLRKSGYTLSQAFRMAWKLAKGNALVKVAGVSKENRQTAIEHLRKYSPEQVQISLAHESTNPYDSNAIAIYISVNSSKAYKIGYVPAVAAAVLCKVIDKVATINASLKAITGGFMLIC